MISVSPSLMLQYEDYKHLSKSFEYIMKRRGLNKIHEEFRMVFTLYLKSKIAVYLTLSVAM